MPRVSQRYVIMAGLLLAIGLIGVRARGSQENRAHRRSRCDSPARRGCEVVRPTGRRSARAAPARPSPRHCAA
jgi:hypothetical protein